MQPLDPDESRSRQSRGRNALLAGCGTTVAVFMLTAFGYLSWANLLPPPERDQRVLPHPNGYDACALAVSSLPALSSTGTPWGLELGALRKQTTLVRPQLATLSAAVRLPYLSPHYDPNYSQQVAPYQWAAAHLAAHSRVELADGRPAAAIDAALDAVELGVKMGRGAGLLNNLVGIRCVAIGQNGAERCVSRLSAKEAHTAGVRLDGILAQLPEPADVVDEERRMSLVWARSVLRGKSPIATSRAANGNPTPWVDQLKERALLVVYPKGWGYSQTDHYWRALVAEFRKPYAQRKAPPLTPPEWDPVLGGMSWSLSSLQFPFARTRAQLRLLRTELALREFRLRHGAHPAKLDELAPECVAVVPVDPFAEQPLRYRRQGEGYLLYSVGPDLRDDGGTAISSRTVDASARGDLVAGTLFARRGRTTSAVSHAPATR
jgi:hypothetical protein